LPYPPGIDEVVSPSSHRAKPPVGEGLHANPTRGAKLSLSRWAGPGTSAPSDSASVAPKYPNGTVEFS
jgi:hypothetical protein